MGRSKLIEITVLGVWLLIAVLFFLKTRQPHNQKIILPESMNTDTLDFAEKGKEFDVRRIVLMDDTKFDIILKDDSSSRILAELPVKMVVGSKGKVLDLLNNSTKPRIVLRNKRDDGKWLVDIFVLNAGKEINLQEWLSENNLIYR